MAFRYLLTYLPTYLLTYLPIATLPAAEYTHHRLARWSSFYTRGITLPITQLSHGQTMNHLSSQPMNSSELNISDDDYDDLPPLIRDDSSSEEDEEKQLDDTIGKDKSHDSRATDAHPKTGEDKIPPGTSGDHITLKSNEKNDVVIDNFPNKLRLEEYGASCYNLPSLLDSVPYPPAPPKTGNAFHYFFIENVIRFTDANPGISKKDVKKLMRKEFDGMTMSSKKKYFKKKYEMLKIYKLMMENRDKVFKQRKEQMKLYCNSRWKRMDAYHVNKDKNAFIFDRFALNTDMMCHVLRFLKLQEISKLDIAINNRSVRECYLRALKFYPVYQPLSAHYFQSKQSYRAHIAWLGDRQITVESTCISSYTDLIDKLTTIGANLKEIEFHELNELNNSTLELVGRICSKLKYISFCCAQALEITDRGILSICRCPNLNVVRICCPNKRSSQFTTKSIDALSKLAYLEELSFPTINAHGMGLVSDCIGQRLKVFQINELDSSICDEDIIKFSSKCSKVEILALEGSKKITDQALNAIGDNMKKIAILSLENCTKITINGIRNLGVKCEMLDHLNLYGIPNINFTELMNFANDSSHISIGYDDEHDDNHEDEHPQDDQTIDGFAEAFMEILQATGFPLMRHNIVRDHIVNNEERRNLPPFPLSASARGFRLGENTDNDYESNRVGGGNDDEELGDMPPLIPCEVADVDDNDNHAVKCSRTNDHNNKKIDDSDNRLVGISTDSSAHGEIATDSSSSSSSSSPFPSPLFTSPVFTLTASNEMNDLQSSSLPSLSLPTSSSLPISSTTFVPEGAPVFALGSSRRNGVNGRSRSNSFSDNKQ